MCQNDTETGPRLTQNPRQNPIFDQFPRQAHPTTGPAPLDPESGTVMTWQFLECTTILNNRRFRDNKNSSARYVSIYNLFSIAPWYVLVPKCSFDGILSREYSLWICLHFNLRKTISFELGIPRVQLTASCTPPPVPFSISIPLFVEL